MRTAITFHANFFVHKGGSDVMASTKMGASTSAYLGGIELQITNETTNSPIYYITVQAENGAGATSQLKHSRYGDL